MTSKTQRLYGSTDSDIHQLATMLCKSLDVNLEYVGQPRADYFDRTGAVSSLRLYGTDGTGLFPKPDNDDELWLVSDITIYSTLLVAYGNSTAVSDFHNRLISSDVSFMPMAIYSHEALT